MAADDFVPSGDVLIVTTGSRELLAGRLRDYAGRPFVLRGRRPPLGTGFSTGGLVRWFVQRTPWWTVSDDREWLYTRRASATGPRPGSRRPRTPPPAPP
jgi:hypothetical protein